MAGLEVVKAQGLACLCNECWVPYISLVFCEMWDSPAFNLQALSHYNNCTLRFVVSHISRKTSEIWGTRHSLQVEGQE